MLSLDIQPLSVTLHPSTLLYPDVKTVTATVQSLDIEQYPIVLGFASSSPAGWVGDVNVKTPGGPTPLVSNIDIRAAVNCPIGKYWLVIEAYTYSEPYQHVTGLIEVNVTLDQIYSVTMLPSSAGGYTSPQAGTVTYVSERSIYYAQALPYAPDGFSHWLIDGVTIPGDALLTIDGTVTPFTKNITLKAVFFEKCKITVTADVGGLVTVNGLTPESTPIYVNKGQSIHLIADANATHIFSYWIMNGARDGQETDWYYTPIGDVAIHAVFTSLPPGQCVLIVKVSGNGSTIPLPGSHPYLITTPPQQVALTATPDSGASFAGWIIDDQSGYFGPSLIILMDESHEVTATFTGGENDGGLNEVLIAGVIVAAGVAAALLLSK